MTDAVRRRLDRPAALGDRALAGSEKLRFFPLVAASGHGCLVTDEDGREYLDLSAGWTAAGIGYAHPEVVAAVTDAITHQAYTGGISASIPVTSGLVEDLISRFPHVENPRVYLGNSGTDANDVALRLCREYTGRQRIISFENSYHGGLGLAMAVSGVHVAAGSPRIQIRPFFHIQTRSAPTPETLRLLQKMYSRGCIPSLSGET